MNKDPTQIEYYSEKVKNIVGIILAGNRSITEKKGDRYKLIDSQDLSQDQISKLIFLCQLRFYEFEQKRSDDV